MSNSKIFVTGGPVPLNSPTYIVRDTDEQAYEAVRNKDYLTIVAPRQMGKTSLLHRVQDIAENQYGYATAYLDMSVFNEEGARWITWAQQVCGQIRSQLTKFCRGELYAEPPKSPVELTRFLSALSRQVDAASILILLDEAASVPSGIRDQFYSEIRALYNSRSKGPTFEALGRCNFVFAGVFEPERLVQNRLNSPFNVSEIVQLQDFTLIETRELLENLARVQPVEITDDFAEAVYAWTEGHPYLTQRLAAMLARYLKSEGIQVLNSERIDSLIPELLESARNNIDHVTKLAVAVKGPWASRVLGGETVAFSPANRELCELEMTGAIKVVKAGLEAKCRIRNRVYKVVLEQARVSLEPGPPDTPGVTPSQLLQVLKDHFNDSELHDLGFQLDIDYEGLSGDNKSDKARELVAYCNRHGRLTDLATIIKRLRPRVVWQ